MNTKNSTTALGESTKKDVLGKVYLFRIRVATSLQHCKGGRLLLRQNVDVLNFSVLASLGVKYAEVIVQIAHAPSAHLLQWLLFNGLPKKCKFQILKFDPPKLRAERLP